MPNPILDTVNIDGTTYDIADSQARTALSSVPSDIVTSVNGESGTVVVDQIQTTAGSNNTEYNLIGTATSNTNNAAVNVYSPTLISFSKYDSNFARLTLGSTATPGQIRLYTSASGASGYTDLKSAATSTNARTITFPDATGTVALTSDIPAVQSWALAANKPSYTFSELTSHPTSVSGYGITDAYTKTEVDGMVSGVLHYKGTKATVSALPSSGNTTGDVWHITADGSEYAWDGSAWQELGTATDLSGYVPTSTKVNNKALSGDITLTASDVGALPSNTTYVSSFNGESGAITYTAPVTSVNGQTGAVTLTIPDADDKTWNGVSLAKQQTINTGEGTYVPLATSVSPVNMSFTPVKATPTANNIAKYDSNACLNSTTPSANDNSTKVATTAYVDAAIPTPDVYWVEIGGTVNWTDVVNAYNNNKIIMGYGSGSGGDTVLYELRDIKITSATDSTFDNNMTFSYIWEATSNCWFWRGDTYTWTQSSQVLASSTHTHGNITNTGDITTTATIASGDRLIINDESASKITNSSITFGSSTTQYLANNGTWQNLPTDNNTTYTLSISGNRITLTPSSGSATYVDLPVYDGGVS